MFVQNFYFRTRLAKKHKEKTVVHMATIDACHHKTFPIRGFIRVLRIYFELNRHSLHKHYPVQEIGSSFFVAGHNLQPLQWGCPTHSPISTLSTLLFVQQSNNKSSFPSTAYKIDCLLIYSTNGHNWYTANLTFKQQSIIRYLKTKNSDHHLLLLSSDVTWSN
jgi:hypothetical protein